MSKIKRLSALLIALLLIMSTAACNANARWIMKVDGDEVPVGVYICYIMQAQSEANGKIDDALAETEKTTEADAEDTTEPTTEATTEATTEEVDYYEHKVEGKDYVAWIKDTAVQKVKEHIVIKQKFAEYKLTLSEEQQDNINSVWETVVTQNNETYGDYYEMNGVSQSSFEEYLTASYQKEELMKYYYGEDGVEPVSDKDLTKKLTEDYATAYILSQPKTGLSEDQSTYETYSDDIIDSLKLVMQDYIKRLDTDEDYSVIEKDFKVDMAEVLGLDPEGEDESDTVSVETEATDDSAKAEEKSDEPTATPNVQLRNITDEDDALQVALKSAKVGKSALAETDGALTVYKKTNDLTENPYYLDSQKETLINDMKGDEFDELIKKWADELKVTVNNSAKSAYGPKDIKSFDD